MSIRPKPFPNPSPKPYNSHDSRHSGINLCTQSWVVIGRYSWFRLWGAELRVNGLRFGVLGIRASHGARLKANASPQTQGQATLAGCRQGTHCNKQFSTHPFTLHISEATTETMSCKGLGLALPTLISNTLQHQYVGPLQIPCLLRNPPADSDHPSTKWVGRA